MSRILWHSGAPWAPTGYGVQTGLFTPRIAALGHHVEISATWGLLGNTLDWQGITVYPGDERYGNRFLPELIDKTKPDVTVTLMDVWVLKPERFQRHNLACWVPVDHDPCPPKVAEFFHKSGARPIAMSRFGEDRLRADGLYPLYVPHGVDTNVYRPLDMPQGELREALGLPRDAFIVGMVANNKGHTPPRKAFPQVLKAFAEFRKTHDDALLYLHAEQTGQWGGQNAGINLPLLCHLYEIPPSAVGFVPSLELELGIDTGTMVGMYNALDVLVNPSYGEGFGIPVVEAQACGVPVIVSDFTSMSELCGAGWKLEGQGFGGVPEPWWDPDHFSYYTMPSAREIEWALGEAYDRRGDGTLSAQAREFALQYDADRVTEEFWVPVLEQLGRPREVPPLPNRAMRRAAERSKAA